MKIIKTLGIVFSAIIVLASCSKEKEIQGRENGRSLDDYKGPGPDAERLYGYGLIGVHTDKMGDGAPSSIQFAGAFSSSPIDEEWSTPIDVGTITLIPSGSSVASIAPNANNSYMASPSRNSSFTMALAGNSVALSVPGGGSIDSSYTMSYVPAPLKLLEPIAKTVSKTSLPTLEWSADDGYDEQVAIFIEYEMEYSNEKDANMPDSPIYLSKLTDDDGSYTLTAADLEAFPTGGFVQIAVARGVNQFIEAEDERAYAYSTYSYVRQTYQIIE